MCALIPVCLLVFSCSQNGQSTEPDPPIQAEKPSDGNQTDFEKDFGKSLKVTLVNPETGEKKVVDAEIEVKEKDRYLLYPEREDAKVSLIGLNIVDSHLNPMSIPLDKVTLLTYWSADSLERDLYWSQMRALEEKYGDSEEIQFITLNHDMSLQGKDQIAAATQFLENYTKPKNLYFDLDDGFRDQFWVPGPVSYYLIDHRGQMTHAARGDGPPGQEVFDAIENALKFQKYNKQTDQRKVQLEFAEEN